jgi:hypothetical protein
MAARLAGAALVTAVLCSAAAAAEKRLPSVELLEFLADFETAGGKAVDPLQFAMPAGEKKTAKRAAKPKKQQGRSAPVRSKGEKP